MAKKRKSKAECDYDINPYVAKLDYELDEHQKRYVKAMLTTPVTFVDAKSGTGKTTLAVYAGFEMLRRGQCQQLVYVRFVDDRYLKQGFLPGELEDKEKYLFYPFYDALVECNVSEKAFELLKAQEQVILTTDTTMRGRNLKDTFLIVDECQNAKSVSDIRLLLTRLHDKGGRAVMIGHSGQQDNKKYERIAGYAPFQLYQYHMSKKPFCKVVELVNDYRGEISRWADAVDETILELNS